VYDLRLSLIDVLNFGDRWMLITSVTPAIASDLEQPLSSRDFIFMAGLQVRNQVRSTLSWGVGLASGLYFGLPQLVPVLSLDWRPNGKWSLNALLPSEASVWYAASSRVNVGLQGRLDANFYNLQVEDDVPEDETPVSDPKARFLSVSFGPVLGVTLTDGASLQLQVAYHVGGRFELYDGRDKVETADREPGALFRLVFSVGR
jgi:hypothetical protein